MIAPRMPYQAAHSLLARRCVTGEELLLSARMVGDISDYDLWRQRRAYWIEETSDLLLRIWGGQGALATFRDTVTVPAHPGGWQQGLSLQIDHTKAALAKLRALLEELQSELGEDDAVG